MEEYEQNPEFKKYVDVYCNKHKISPETALQHWIVKAVGEEYKAKRLNTGSKKGK